MLDVLLSTWNMNIGLVGAYFYWTTLWPTVHLSLHVCTVVLLYSVCASWLPDAVVGHILLWRSYFDVSFPEKHLKTVATRGEIFSLKFTKYRLAAGLRPDPLGELKRSPRPPNRNKGGLLLKGGEGRGRGEGKGEGRGGEGQGPPQT